MYVSTRGGGTSIFRTASPRECHQVQWNMEASHIGKFVQEKEFIPPSPDQRKVVVGNVPGSINKHVTRQSSARISNFLLGLIRRSCDIRHFRRCSHVLAGSVNKRRVGCRDSSSEKPPLPVSSVVRLASLPEGHIIPHPIFARKFALIENNEPVPRSMASNLMPTADSVATLTGAGMTDPGVLDSRWVFRGPFTPQLGFDGGRDFEWDPMGPAHTDSKISCQPVSAGLRGRVMRAEAVARDTRKVSARPAHDWFGLDAELPALPGPGSPSSAPRRSPYWKQPVHGYNWFGLD